MHGVFVIAFSWIPSEQLAGYVLYIPYHGSPPFCGSCVPLYSRLCHVAPAPKLQNAPPSLSCNGRCPYSPRIHRGASICCSRTNRRLAPLLNSAFRGRRLIRLSTLASSSAEHPALTPIVLHYGSLQGRTLRVLRAGKWKALLRRSRWKEPGLLCGVI